MDGTDLASARRDAAASSIRTLRTNLLDLTATNPLVSFSHNRARGLRVNVRAVDVCLNTLFEQVVEGRTIPLRPLPPVDDEPADEQTATFKTALEAARTIDLEFQKAQAELAEDELTSAAAARVERGLRDRVRVATGLPARKLAVSKSLADHAVANDIDPSFELQARERDTGDGAKVPTVVFQALMLPDPLQQTLAKIRDTARTFAEETGVSTLHLAFGFLEWFESDSSDKPLVSPLLVVQVELERSVVRSRYQYTLTATGDEPQPNATLSERLNKDFRVRLPEMRDEEELEGYLQRVQEDVCKGRSRWRIHRFVTLAQFPFARLAMFNDLDEASWAGTLSSHPLLGRLLGGSEGGEASFAEEHDVDGKEVAEKVPLLVLEADASQHSAVYDVMTGKSLVIEGPPGTGKSQTITNIIAAALAADKRVLFMADKQAALQVVKDRLDKVGLGDFCLELHSGKAKKTEVLEGLRRRMERRPAAPGGSALGEKMRELEAARRSLNEYAASLNAPLGKIGATVHDILWADRRRRADEGDEARQLDAVIIRDSLLLTETDIDKRKALLARFELAAAPVLARAVEVRAHPWFGMTRTSLSSVDIDEALRAVEDAAAAAELVTSNVASLLDFGLTSDGDASNVERAARLLADLPVRAHLPANLFTGLAHEAVRQGTRTWIPLCRAYQAAVERLGHWGVADKTLDWEAVATEVDGGLEFLSPSPPGLTVAGVPAWAESLDADAQRLLTVNAAMARPASVLGFGAPGSCLEIELLLRACTHVRELDVKTISTMSPQMTTRDAGDVVAAAAAEIRALRDRAAGLDKDYRLQPAPDAAELRQAAATLREAGMLAFLSAKVKQAARVHDDLRKTPVQASRPEMAAALVALAAYHDDVAALAANRTYQTTFGTRFRGIDTDVDAALAATGWATRVRNGFGMADEAAGRLRGALLCGDPDRLETLHVSLSAVAVDDLRSALPKVVDDTATPETAAADLRRRARGATTFAGALTGRVVAGSVECAGLPRFRDALQQATRAKQAAAFPPEVAVALGAEAPTTLTDLSLVEQALDAASAVAGSGLPPEVRARLLATSPTEIAASVVPRAVSLIEAVQALPDVLERARRELALDDPWFFGCDVRKAGVGRVAARLRLAAAHKDAIGEWLTYLIERENAEALGLGGLLKLWDDRTVVTSLPEAFDRALHRSLARAALVAHPQLDRHTGLGHEEVRARFKQLDAETTELRRRMLAETLTRKQAPWGVGVGKRGEYTEGALLALEAGKQRRHVPIRTLLDRAGTAIQALKPCFMMSPLSVSQYLKPGGLRFDLLVIDEASQMRPEDALGAIARSDQIVVVGDPKQLPPTAFFAANDDAADDDDGAEEKVDAESILDLAQTVFRPMRRLRWHYRSRHGSLIAFSNREFYDDDLIVFPSPAEAVPTQGVGLVKVDGIYKARSNVVEVEALCAAAVEHMRKHPGRSLGVATMNGIQRDLIQQRMDQLAAQLPEVEDYRQRWSATLERFFVKNLENVQGDERDVIFISTVFGSPEPGARVRQNFGPINGASGHRRLNVLFTRAKHHVRVFTSMTPDDIAAGPDSPRGARVLKSYLAYAADGRLDAGIDTGREPDSDFEVFVRDRLRRAGYEAIPQVGVAGFFIDLAVRHPDVPGTYLVGIECDGASYHSSRSARDRDILRQQVLEGLGWSIYRIWSTDWFRDPAGQTAKMVAAIEELRAKSRLRRRPVGEAAE